MLCMEQGLPEDAARALRENFLAKADAMFPVRARGRRVAAASAAGLGAPLPPALNPECLFLCAELVCCLM